MGYPIEACLAFVKVDAISWLMSKANKSQAEAEQLAVVLDDQVPQILDLGWAAILDMVACQDDAAYSILCGLISKSKKRIMDNANTQTTVIDDHFMASTYFAVIGWLVGTAGVTYDRAEKMAQKIHAHRKQIVGASFGVALELVVENDEELNQFFQDYAKRHPKIFEKDEPR